MRKVITLLIGTLLCASSAAADETARQADPNKFAVIICGASGEETYAKQFAAWSENLRQTLTGKLNFAPERITTLAEKTGGSAATLPATAAELRKVFASLRGAVTADSTVFVFLIGHGTYDGQQAKFNLVGPDLPAAAYKEMLGELVARRIVTINMSSASGEFIKPLAGPGRIIITATRSGQEQNATRFPEHFIAALGNAAADADKNNRISILEAFNFATKQTAEFYQTAGHLATEHALLEDDGDGVGHQKAEAGDGALARQIYFDSVAQTQIANDHVAAQLLAQRTQLENAIQGLKTRKNQMAGDEYYAELEKLFLDLAKLNRELKTKSGGK